MQRMHRCVLVGRESIIIHHFITFSEHGSDLCVWIRCMAASLYEFLLAVCVRLSVVSIVLARDGCLDKLHVCPATRSAGNGASRVEREGRRKRED